MEKAIIIFIFLIMIVIQPIKADETKIIRADPVIKAFQEKPIPTTNPVLALAKICVNEEGWYNKTGCAAIWQVVKNVRSKTCNKKRIPLITQCKYGRETYLSAMRRLSKRITGLRAPTTTQQVWTSTLQNNNKPPTRWIECTGSKKVGTKKISTPTGCHGVWKLYSKAWADMRQTAQDLYHGRVEELPCPKENELHGPVIAWGCTADLWLAKRRGLVQIDCGDTGNMFFAKPKEDYSPKSLIARSDDSSPSSEQ